MPLIKVTSSSIASLRLSSQSPELYKPYSMEKKVSETCVNECQFLTVSSFTSYLSKHLLILHVQPFTRCVIFLFCFSKSQGWQFQAIFMTDALVWTYVLFASVCGDYIRLKGAWCALLALLGEPRERERDSKSSSLHWALTTLMTRTVVNQLLHFQQPHF